jgi:hypothetical protein
LLIPAVYADVTPELVPNELRYAANSYADVEAAVL